MFESAEIGHHIDHKTWKQREPELRAALLEMQFRLLREARFAVVILVNGVDLAGRGETVNVLNEWMDPRHIRTEAFGPMSEFDHQQPEMFRFWQVLPPKGHIGILFGNWYTDPIEAHKRGHEKHEHFVRRLERIRQFERMLVAEGVLLLKFWFHLSKKAAKARLKELQDNPRTAWRVTPQEQHNLRHYDELISISDEALRKTSVGEAPWLVIEGSDPYFRYLTAGQLLLDSVLQRLDRPVEHHKPVHVAPETRPLDSLSLLAAQDYGRRLVRKHYEERIETLQGRLNGLSRDPRMRHRALVVVFEGMDAAGKGSTIRRLTQALDARFYRVIPVAAPNENERAQPYLWRFWRYIPRQGRATLFDRSWYGRVLVERVENFCSEADWMRAYGEINEFEEEISEAGAVIVKFWLAITPEEQLRRFNERVETPHKTFKITDEDWRNRAKWPQYEQAVGDMIDRTSTRIAPWHVIASDDKLWVRIAVLETLCERLEQALAASA